MSVSLTKSDGCGKNNDCWALGPGLRYFEGHEPPLILVPRFFVPLNSYCFYPRPYKPGTALRPNEVDEAVGL